MRHAAALLVAPVLFLLLAAPSAAPAPVEVHLSEYAIQMPDTLPAGAVTFQVQNDGQKVHSFKIEGPGLAEMLEKPVPPHQSGTLQVTLQPGEYKVYCPVGSHEAKGMTRKLVVTKQEG